MSRATEVCVGSDANPCCGSLLQDCVESQIIWGYILAKAVLA